MEEHEQLHNAQVRREAPGCTLLLKKDNSFPLASPCPLALFGSGARHTVYGGSGSGEVNSRETISIEEGLERVGFTITTSDWLNAYDLVRLKALALFKKRIVSEALHARALPTVYGMGAIMPEPEYTLPLGGPEQERFLLKGTVKDTGSAEQTVDTAVYVLARSSGEGADRTVQAGDVLLTKTEIRDILQLNRQYPRFMLVLNVGGPVDLTPVQSVKNIFLLSQLGAQTGTIFADILLGRSVPSGKLSTTWPAAKDIPAVGDFGDPNDTYYKEGIYVGYRYFDTAGVTPLYPFGFGLTYTDFSVQVLSVALKQGTQESGAQEQDARGINALTRIKLTVSVKNTGRYPGREVVQIYLSCPNGVLDEPFQVLAGFVKTKELRPGETEEVTICFAPSDFASFDENVSAFLLEKGAYFVRVGTDSRHTKIAAKLTLSRTVLVQRAVEDTRVPGFSDKRFEKAALYGETGLRKKTSTYAEFDLDPDNLTKELEVSDGDAPHTPQDPFEAALSEIKSLSDEALVRLTVGQFDEHNKLASVIGNASKRVAGAAGETTDLFESEGVPGLVMADGPAGLRLSKDFFIGKQQRRETAQANLPESSTWLLPGWMKRIVNRFLSKKPPKFTLIHHQYCTSIPIGTAIAQSFDVKMAQDLGSLIGEEMQRFGVNLWLAPALNIHRSILCGRNYEYFSEDPLLSGKMAAAETRGVQAHARCGVTIKHFVANNQESGRYTSNSHVSARALREIYLCGFEICIREAKPAALMTSYNLLNGVHTAEDRELLERIAREQFGFKGLIMTDWIVAGFGSRKAKYPLADPVKSAAAGNDLLMPGSKKELNQLLSALKSGRLDRKTLQRNAARVLQLMKRLAT